MPPARLVLRLLFLTRRIAAAPKKPIRQDRNGEGRRDRERVGSGGCMDARTWSSVRS